MMDNIAAKFASCTMPSYDDEQDDILAEPVSSCYSDDLSASSAVPVTHTAGKFSDIKYKYRINPRVLGTGYQGSVRECTNHVTGERFAVKTIRKTDRGMKNGDLALETALLREMKHRSIIQLVDVYEYDEHFNIVTDLCEGGELFDRVVERTVNSDGGAPCFGEGEATRLLHQILAAVSYMHNHRVVHRDLKPENILLDTAAADSPIKIIDFGLAKKHFGNGGEPPMSSIVGCGHSVLHRA